jgi:hypothetical protein
VREIPDRGLTRPGVGSKERTRPAAPDPLRARGLQPGSWGSVRDVIRASVPERRRLPPALVCLDVRARDRNPAEPIDSRSENRRGG